MDCKQIDELLVDHLYGEVDDAQGQAFEAHLEACERCAAEVASFKQTRLAFGELEQLEPPPQITQALLAEAARAAPQGSSFGERLRSLMRVFIMHPALAAAATLVVVLGVSFYTYRQGLPPARHDRRSDLPLGLDERHQGVIRPARETRPAAAADEQPKKEEGEAAGEPARVALGNASPGASAAQNQGLDGVGVRAAQDRDGELKSSGPVPLRYARRARRPSTGSERQRSSEISPPAQAAVPAGANVDDLKRRDSNREAAKKQAAYRPKSKSRPAPAAAPKRPSPRRRAARRQANVADVGGGSSGVWANKGRARGGAGKASGSDDFDRTKQDRLGVSATRKTQKKSKAKSEAPLLLAAGAAAVRAGRCKQALDLYLKVLAARPDLTESVIGRLGPCRGKLSGHKGYKVVARRAERRRKARKKARKKAPRKATTAKPAAQQQQPAVAK